MTSFESLVRDHHATVYRIAMGVLRDSAAAEDVTQDVFLEFLRNPGALERAESPRAFLGRAAVNRALNARRGEARRMKHELEAHSGEASMNPVEEVFRREIRAKVSELPEEERLAVDLHYFQGFTISETGAALAIAPRTVSARITEALSRLRKALGAAAFVALLAGLESELSHCGASEIPTGLSSRLLRLRVRPATPAAHAGRRFAAVAVSIGVAILLALLGGRAVLARRNVPVAGSDAAPMDALRGVAAVTDGLTAALEPLVIDRDLDLHGIVVNEAGDPVADALLATVTEPWMRASMMAAEHFDEEVAGPGTRSRADGQFAIRLRRGDVVTLRIEAEGFAPYELPSCQAGERLRIVLKPGVRLAIRAIDEDGRPVAGVRLRINGGRQVRGWLHFERKGLTGDDGICTVENLPPGEKGWIWAEHDTLGGPGIFDFEVPATGEGQVDLPMVRGRELTGRVTDADTGKPIAGARVGFGWMIAVPVTTDAEGRFRLPRWTGNGMDDITADAEGYATRSAIVGDSRVVDLALFPGCTVTGRLVAAGGGPVAHARLSAIGSMQVGDLQVVSHRSGVPDSQGRFRIAGLRRDMPHTLIVIADGLGRKLVDFDAAPGVVDLGDVTLARGLSVEGRVLDATGTPAARVEVTLIGFNDDRTKLRPGSAPLDFFYGRSENVCTDDLGRFRFRDLAPGSYVARIRSEGAADITAPVALVDQDVTGVELRLPGADGIRVLVLDEHGEPLEGTFVTAQSPDGTHASSLTGGDGRCLLKIEADLAWVTVGVAISDEHPVLIPPSQTVRGGRGDLTFRLEPAGFAEGMVVDAEGNPFPSAPISVLIPNQDPIEIEADYTGFFRVEFPLPGPVDLEVSGTSGDKKAPLFLEGRLDRVIAGAKGLRIVARIVALDRSITVRVTDGDGAPIADAYVTAIASGEQVAEVKTAADGLATLDKLPAVSVVFEVGPPASSGCIRTSVTAVPGGQELAVELRKGAVIEGLVVDLDGKPLMGVSISASAPGHRTSCASGPDGRFRLVVDPDPSLSWKLIALTRELQGGLEPVRAGGTPVTLRLEKPRK